MGKPQTNGLIELVDARSEGRDSSACGWCPIDSLQEPVSVDLANAAIEYCGGDKGSDARVRAAFVAGANWRKEQMMKDAVYGLVCGHDDNSPAWIDLNLLNKPDVKVGEEIKLIIIKEE